MRIEDVTIEKVASMPDMDLYNLRLRVVQIWEKHFAKTTMQHSGTISRAYLLDQYGVVKGEMSNRGLRPAWADIDSYVLRHKMMEGLDPAIIGEIVLEPACVIVGGDFAHDPRGAEVCDLFISPDVGHPDIFKRALSTRIVKQVNKPVEFHFNQDDVGDVCLPLFDLVLRPRAVLEKVRSGGVGHGDNPDESGTSDLSYCPECGTTATHDRGTPSNKMDCPDCGTMMTGIPPVEKSHPNEIVVTKPGFEESENEIRYRVRDPGRFDDGSFRRIALQQKSPRVYAIIGHLKGESSTTIQALRFPKGEGWDIPKARSWVSSHRSVTKMGVDLMKISAEGGVSEEDVEDTLDEVEKNVGFTVKKVDEDEHIVGGVIYAPGCLEDETTHDADGDFATAEDIRKAAYGYMLESQQIKLMHQGLPIRASVIESFIVPVDFEAGDQIIKAGSWWVSVHVNDTNAWTAIKSGEITGFSMGGIARSE